MLNKIKNFVNNESGAVTIDWVILTAGVVVMAIAIYNVVDGMSSSLANNAAGAVASFNADLFN